MDFTQFATSRKKKDVVEQKPSSTGSASTEAVGSGESASSRETQKHKAEEKPVIQSFDEFVTDR